MMVAVHYVALQSGT